MRRGRRSRSPLLKFGFFVLGLAALYGGYYAGNRYAPIEPKFVNLHALETPAAFELQLTDHYGKPFHTEQLADHWNLILFGYTRAPEAARIGLALVTEVVNRLAAKPELQAMTRAILISVDPVGDTPETLHDFLTPFSPDFIGLTGSANQVDEAARKLGVKVTRVPDAGSTSFRIDHGTSIGLVGPGGKLRGLFAGVVDAVSIAADIQKLAVDDHQ